MAYPYIEKFEIERHLAANLAALTAHPCSMAITSDEQLRGNLDPDFAYSILACLAFDTTGPPPMKAGILANLMSQAGLVAMASPRWPRASRAYYDCINGLIDDTMIQIVQSEFAAVDRDLGLV